MRHLTQNSTLVEAKLRISYLLIMVRVWVGLQIKKSYINC